MLPKGFSVTLVEPKGPVNVGHIARLVKNFGVPKLYLVDPRFDVSVAAVYASHASAVLDDAVTTSFARVREENDLLVATTAVRALKRSNVIRRTVNPDRLPGLIASARSSSLVFGRDTTGLNNEEISLCDVTTTIDTEEDYRALNIGHAAAILLYLASRHARRGVVRHQGRKSREVFARRLSELGELSRTPGHKTQSLFDVGKRIAASSSMTDRQLNLLAGVFGKAISTIEALQDGDSKA